ncbi:MAG: hypothetical protein R3E08_05570 [Thiotrichaceae bacterium]
MRGLECLQSLGHDLPDLILLDLMMLEMDGFEFASRPHQEPDLVHWLYRGVDR